MASPKHKSLHNRQSFYNRVDHTVNDRLMPIHLKRLEALNSRYGNCTIPEDEFVEVSPGVTVINLDKSARVDQFLIENNAGKEIFCDAVFARYEAIVVYCEKHTKNLLTDGLGAAAPAMQAAAI